MKLNDHQLAELQDLARATSRANDVSRGLEQHGLVVTGHGRFGSYARITEAGRQYLDRTSGRGGRAASTRGTGDTVRESIPVAGAGPAQAGALLRGAAPRISRDAATQAVRAATRSLPAITSPAGPLHVGKISMGEPHATCSPHVKPGSAPLHTARPKRAAPLLSRLMNQLTKVIINGA